MSTGRIRREQHKPLWLLDRATYVFAAFFTLFTIYYAFFLLTNLTLLGLDFRPFVPDQVQFSERAEYVVLFTGIGIAVYYMDYARGQFEDRYDLTDEGAADTDTADAPPAETGDSVSEPPARHSLLDDLGLKSERLSTARARSGEIFERIDPFLSLALAALTLAVTTYIYTDFTFFQQTAHIVGYSSTDYLVGAALLVIVTDATRRAFGWIIASVVVFSLVYMHSAVSTLLPGMLWWTGAETPRIISLAALRVEGGVYDSTIMGIGSTWVAIFIMFAGIAKAYGLMDFIRTIGTELGTTLRTGVVQIAVISSMVMGSITGSAAANTATTGSFTIPMIKDQGVSDDFASAIEAVASAGGQMLPPVMGVAAFLMADIVEVPYLEVVQAGTIPAALFYLSVVVAVHFTILKFGWTTGELDAFDWSVLKQGWHFVIPMAVLLYTLIVLGWTPMTAGLYTIAALIGVIILKNLIGRILNARQDEPKYEVNSISRRTFDGLSQGGFEMAPLVGVLAAMGVIIQLLEGSGLTGRLGNNIIGFADVTILGFTGGLALVLVLAMIASIVFGLGMPTPAAYILVAFLIADAVTELGVPDLTTHMFVFYFAMLSAITPPIAISVAVGSRIAGASFMKSCVQALRLGAPGFVIPFAFVANNNLIQWTGGSSGAMFADSTAFAFPVVLAGTIGLIVATVGFDGARDLSAPMRLLYVSVGAFAMFGSLLPGNAGYAVQAVAAVTIFGFLLRARYLVGYDAERIRGPATTD